MLNQHDQDYFTNRANRMTPEEVTQYTGYTLKTLAQYRYMKKGPPFVKVGQRIYYDKWVLDDWLQCRIKVIRRLKLHL